MVLSLIVLVLAVVLAIALAWIPLQLLMSQMARQVTAFIQRQRERRRSNRGTADRRKEPTR